MILNILKIVFKYGKNGINTGRRQPPPSPRAAPSCSRSVLKEQKDVWEAVMCINFGPTAAAATTSNVAVRKNVYQFSYAEKLSCMYLGTAAAACHYTAADDTTVTATLCQRVTLMHAAAFALHRYCCCLRL